MAQSTNTDWTLTFAQLAASAAMELGAIGMGDSLEASEEEEMRLRANAMLAKWSTDGNLWRDELATIQIAAGAGAATLPSEIRDIRGVRHIQSSTYKRPLGAWNRDEYLMLPNRAQAGTPTIYYFQPAIGGGVLRVWPVPATIQSFELDISRRFHMIEDPTQEVDILPEWHEAALYGLAARCANIFGTTRVDPNTVQRIDAQAKSEFDKLLDSDRPDYYAFGYDSPVEVR